MSENKSSKFFWWTLISLFFLIPAFLFALFVYGELTRKWQLESYEPPLAIKSQFLREGSFNVGTLFLNDETELCLVHAYATDARNLENSSISIRDSIHDLYLPSEDMTWYAIFINDEKVSRVYIFHTPFANVFGCYQGNDVIRIVKTSENPHKILGLTLSVSKIDD